MIATIRVFGVLAVGLLLAIPATAQPPPAGGDIPTPPTGETETPPEVEGEGTPAEGETPPAEGEAAPAEGEGAPAEGEAPPAGERRQLIVIDAATYGIDPVVGRHVSQQMRSTGAELGYSVLSGERSVAAAQQLRMPYPPTPADLWRVTYVSESHRGAFARVWAHSGQYVIEITVASMDGTGPFFARGNSGAADLHGVVDQLLKEALPPPDHWREQASTTEGQAETTEGEGATTEGATTEGGEFAEEGTGEAVEERPRRRRRRHRPLRRRIHLVLQTEGAIGTSQDSFYNHLVGFRVDYRISREILFGAYLGYANLRGKDGRTSNILSYLQIEDRVRISSSSDITVPLRLGIGYLPFNGPVVRLAAGVNIPLSRDFQLGFDILTPTFWVLPDRTAVSLDIAAELIWRP